MEHHNRSIRQSIIQSIYRPFLLLTLEPMCLNLCLFSAVLLGVLYLFFGAFVLVFEENHRFNLWQVGLTFSGLLVGIIVAVASDPLWHRNYVRLIRNRELNGGEKGGSDPEYRLPPAILGGVLVPIGLFWYVGLQCLRGEHPCYECLTRRRAVEVLNVRPSLWTRTGRLTVPKFHGSASFPGCGIFPTSVFAKKKDILCPNSIAGLVGRRSPQSM